MKRWLAVAVMVMACGGKSGPEVAPSGAVFEGSCTKPPESNGSSTCVETWLKDVPEGVNGQAIAQGTCDAKNTYSTGHCAAGAQPGCCKEGPLSDGSIYTTCYYNTADPQGQLEHLCTSSGYTWN